jgi:hypothetical protein
MSKRLIKNNRSIKTLFKKIIYYFCFIFLTYFTINFSEKHYTQLEQARTQAFKNSNFLFKIVSFPFLPLQIFHNKEEVIFSTILLEKTFWEINLQKENLLLSELKMLKKTIFDFNLSRYNLIFINPKYYSSTGFLTDVIFNSNTLSEAELENVKPNFAVISDKGLYGRISSVAGAKISIISIFNILSRIPVYTKTSKVYGIASGNGNEIFFIYPNDDEKKLLEGEVVFTSEENDLIISDIPFGKLQYSKGKYHIIPFSKTRPTVLGIINKN